MIGNALAAVLLAGAALMAPAPPSARLSLSVRRTKRPFAVLVGIVVIGAVVMSAAPSLVLAFLIAAGSATSRLRRKRQAQRGRREGEAIAAALDVLVGELQVGAHPVAAFALAGVESDGPVGDSLQAVATRARVGADVAEGIRAVGISSAVPTYWERIAVFWQLAAEQGLPMAVLMRAAHRDIVDRQRFGDRMHAALAGARATAVILAALPAFGILLGQFVGADPIGFLLSGGLGGVLLVAGVALICTGILWADRIVDRLAT